MTPLDQAVLTASDSALERYDQVPFDQKLEFVRGEFANAAIMYHAFLETVGISALETQQVIMRDLAKVFTSCLVQPSEVH